MTHEITPAVQTSSTLAPGASYIPAQVLVLCSFGFEHSITVESTSMASPP